MPAPEGVRLCVWCRKRPVDPPWRPFCSERCKVQDLARWADGSYAVPGEGLTEAEESPNEDGNREKEQGRSQK